MLHYYLENHGLNATVLHFNADNCAGQNKNNAVIQVNLVKIVYTFFILRSIIVLVWRVLTGLDSTTQISFLPAGHTKFAPDWCFGLLEQKFRKTDVDSLLDFINVVNESASVSKAQLVGETNGNVIVPTRLGSNTLSICI